MLLESDQEICALLTSTRRIALVGASARSERASNRIFKFLLEQGYDVTPVNPVLAGQMLHGVPVAESLGDIEGDIDMVDIFRNSAAAGDVVDEESRHGSLPENRHSPLGLAEITPWRLNLTSSSPRMHPAG